MRKYYNDDRFCGHCNKETTHKCYDTNHERDRSWDYEECLICHYHKYGVSDEQYPPLDVDKEY